LLRLEKGDPCVGIGNFVSVVAALGSPAALAEIMVPENDAVGFARALQALPKRRRSFKPGKPAPTSVETAGQVMGHDDKPRERKGIGF
jgi:hypothetical protein